MVAICSYCILSILQYGCNPCWPNLSMIRGEAQTLGKDKQRANVDLDCRILWQRIWCSRRGIPDFQKCSQSYSIGYGWKIRKHCKPYFLPWGLLMKSLYIQRLGLQPLRLRLLRTGLLRPSHLHRHPRSSLCPLLLWWPSSLCPSLHKTCTVNGTTPSS